MRTLSAIVLDAGLPMTLLVGIWALVGSRHTAQAQGGEPAEALGAPVTRVAVLVVAVDAADADTADGLTEVLIGAVATRAAERGGVSIVGKEELQSQLQQEEARTLECVSSIACLGRVGVQLELSEVVAGSLRRRGEGWVFNLNRIDIRSGELVGRVFREVAGDLGGLAAAFSEAVPELYEQPERPGRLQIAADVEGARISLDGEEVGTYRGEPLRVAEVEPGQHRVRASAPGHQPWERVVTLAPGAELQVEAGLVPEGSQGVRRGRIATIWTGASTAGLGALMAISFGISSQRGAREPSRADSVQAVERRRRQARAANAGWVLLAAGAGTMTIGLLLSRTHLGDERAAPAVTPLPGGALVSIEGSFGVAR